MWEDEKQQRFKDLEARKGQLTDAERKEHFVVNIPG